MTLKSISKEVGSIERIIKNLWKKQRKREQVFRNLFKELDSIKEVLKVY